MRNTIGLRPYAKFTDDEINEALVDWKLGALARDLGVERGRAFNSTYNTLRENRLISAERGYNGAPKLYDVFRGLSPEVKRWFVDQIPEGATAADLLRAILMDAYNDAG